ncbi:hypothetical protein AAFN46_16510 [Pseudomonas sp. CAU 1711]|uniref:glycine-rich domain-containing protein n=1 Tax=Pseudomonas sp. CAU 1711 TaxID=3140356 RepID=UPI0032609BA1
MSITSSLLTIALLWFIVYYWRAGRQRSRERFIDAYRFPARLESKLLERYPQLTPQQANEVLHGLREYFQLCRLAGRKMVAMPSQAVDVVWHEFILHTRQYRSFCRQGLGSFLDHTPNEAMPRPQDSREALHRAWQLACRRQHLSPQHTQQLPWLFALDAELGIADGFRYSRDCGARPGTIGADGGFCVSHFGCGSGGGCGGDSGSSGDGAADGGGCGGGCGGGGD